jgi:hypothetical protein
VVLFQPHGVAAVARVDSTLDDGTADGRCDVGAAEPAGVDGVAVTGVDGAGVAVERPLPHPAAAHESTSAHAIATSARLRRMNARYAGQCARMDARTLAKLYAIDGPFVTIYLATPSDVEDAAEQLEVRWKNVVRELSDAGVDNATIEALTAARGGHERGNTRLLVAAHGTVHLAVSLPQPPPQEMVLTGQLPHLVPLLDALSLQLPHLVVLADRTGADILAYTAGPDPVETEAVQTDRWPEHKTGRGGWAAKRYDATVTNNWHENAKDVAATVDKVAADIGARLVIAAGDDRALALLEEHLPQRLIDLLVKIPGGGRHLDGSDEVVAERITEALAERVAGDTLALLEKFAEERGQADRAADGVAATLEALQMAQVGTLIFADTRDRERTLFFGPEPVHLALTPEELLDLGVEQPWEALAEEVLARAALGTGAEIRFVGGGMEQAPTEGVGALLRYAD